MKTNRNAVASLAAAIALVALGTVASFRALRQVHEAADARTNTIVVIRAADKLLSAMKDAETGQRGYLLSGEDRFLEPYLLVRDTVIDDLETLRKRTMTDAARKHLDALLPLVDAKMAELSRVIDLYRNHDATAALAIAISAEGRQLMDLIRAEVRSFIQMEDDELRQRDAEYETDMRHLHIGIAVTSPLVLMLVLWAAHSFFRKALFKAAALHKAIFDSANFSSIATDAKGVIQIFNVGAERMLGYKVADVMNKITPADISDAQEVIARAKALSAELGTPITPGFEALAFKASRGIEDIYELTYIRKDGSPCPVLVSVTALRDAHDAIIGYLLIGADNTARKRAEQTQSRLAAMLDATPDFVGYADAKDTHIIHINAAGRKMIGVAGGEDVTRLKIADVHPEWMNKLFRDEIFATVMRDGVWQGEGALLNRDGREIPVMMVLLAHKSPSGEVETFSTISRDITERKRAEAAVAQALRAKSEFMNNVTHELRTPLNSVIGFAGLLKDEVPGPLNAKQAGFAADILASGQQLLALVEGILEMSRLDTTQAALEREPVEIGAALEERVAAHRKAAEARGLTMRLDVAADTGSAELDPKALRRMLDALLDNAIKFNREGGAVAVSVRRAGGALEIAVADTGVGIAREDLAKLFKPLVQLDAGLAREHGGLGLKLALARCLAELHGGTIEVESEPGQGSTFTLRLPIREKS